MSRATIPDEQKAVNAGISLPPEIVEMLTKAAFRDGKSKSALAQEIFRSHFKRLKRNARRAANKNGGKSK